MPIAKLKREKRKDPLWGIIISRYRGFCAHGLPAILRYFRLAPIIHVDDYAVLGGMSANVVWGLVCIWNGDFYRLIA